MKRMSVLLVTAVFVLTIGVPALAQDDTSLAVGEAIGYLDTIQNPDGGFSNGFAPESDFSTTADVVVALAIGGEDPNAFFSGDMMNPLTYLGVQLNEADALSTGLLVKSLNAVVAAGKDPYAFAGHDLVDDLLAAQDPETGVIGAGTFDHCLAMLALQNTGTELPEGTLDVALSAQNEDGGWAFMTGESSDTNTTAVCLQALALEAADVAVSAGLSYLEPIQNEDGGWPYQNPSDFGTDSDVNSTALVVQALVALGEDLSEWDYPQDWLLSMQLASGAFSYQEAFPGDNVLATIAVIPALVGLPLNAWAPEPVM